MNVFDFLSDIRNHPECERENDITTRELLRILNGAYAELCQKLWSKALFRDKLKHSYSKSISAQRFDVPVRYKAAISIWRATKECRIIQPDQESLLASNVNYAPSTTYPVAVDKNGYFLIYPTISTSTAMVMAYFRQPLFLEFGVGTSLITGENVKYITFDNFAVPKDDWYNDEYIDIYQSTASGVTFIGRYSISDYTGSTRKAEITLVAGDAIATATEYIYAFVPAILEDYHSRILQAAKIKLVANGKIQENGAFLVSDYDTFIAMELGLKLPKQTTAKEKPNGEQG